MTIKPLVTVITPTTHDRAAFNQRCHEVVRAQDYPNIEHLVSYRQFPSLGEKMNYMCGLANGNIIVNIDSDDLFAPDWVSRCAETIADYDVIGLKKAYFHNPTTGELFAYTYPDSCNNLHGGTMCHTKAFWQRNPYKHMQVGYDVEFTKMNCKTATLDYTDGFIATIHSGNVSPKNTTGERWQKFENIPTSLHTLLNRFPKVI